MNRILGRLRAGLARAALLGAALATVPAALAAQGATGRIVGRVVDANSGVGLSDVQVQVVGTTMGTMSGLDGRFAIPNVPVGTVTLHVRRIGFAPKSVTGIVLDAGKTVEQNVSLASTAVQLDVQVVTAQAERGSVSAALDAQRNATGIVSAIGSEQIARSPDSDAAQAVQRVSGVTVQDGKYVFVRGLGERYTTTSLNGARLPSPEPERKVVPLDLFPSNLLQSVSTTKTFTPDQPGDFSGAQVNLTTREFPAERQVSYSLSLGYNAAATGKDVLGAPRVGSEWIAFGGSQRQLPGTVAQEGNLGGSYAPSDYTRLVRSFRNVWTPESRTGSPNMSASVTLGGSDPIFGREIGYVGSLSYSYGQETRADEVRAFAVPTADGGAGAVDRYTGTTGRESVLWGGLLNLSTMIGTRSRVSLNNTFSRSADNEARFESGFDENLALPLDITRLRFVERSVLSSQLAGEHELTSRQRLNWSVTGSGVTRREPDRSEVVYARDEMGGAPFLLNSTEGAVRTFGDLTEYNVNTGVDWQLRLGSGSREHLVKAGALFRYTTRESQNDSYSLQTIIGREDREVRPEQIFARGDDVYRLVPMSQGGSYEASDVLGGGYLMGEYQLGDRFRLIGGARVETQALDVTARPTFGAGVNVTPTYTDVLPSLALNVQLTGDQALRLSVSQTLARPEYREIAPIASRDVLGGEQFVGNPALERTLIRNADLRWEWYPDRGEVVSLAVFAKDFVDPIERIYRGTSGTRVTTFGNADGAVNYGVEAELRKSLGFLAAPLAPLTFFSNATIMRSEIDLSSVAAGSIDAERAMVGQAPYVVNTGLSYGTDDGAWSATALYNVVGRRIYAASLLPLPSVYEEARNVVDVSLRFPLRGGLSGKLDARNLLDAPYEVTQGGVQREFYRGGRVFSLGFALRR